MTHLQPVTRDGTPWLPLYLDSIDQRRCIGCGRCQKVCSQDVLGLLGLSEDGDVVEIDSEDMERMVADVVNPGKCIGCNACGKVCGAKGAQTHVAASAA